MILRSPHKILILFTEYRLYGDPTTLDRFYKTFGGIIMSLIHWQPVRELDLLRQQMDRLLNEWTIDRDFPKLRMDDGVPWLPAIELEETETDLVLKAQVPGMEAKELEVQVTPDAVMLTGEHQQSERTEEKGFFRSEFRYGQFERKIPLPKTIKNDQVKSTFADGVLTLTLPKAEDNEHKAVKINLGES
jgi:HSP20 family protein